MWTVRLVRVRLDPFELGLDSRGEEWGKIDNQKCADDQSMS